MLKLTGLSEAQEDACCGALQAFLERHSLASWGLNVKLEDEGPQTWRLEISVVASPELDFQIRTSQVSVDKTVDLAQIVDLCLETHYNACMNREAMSHRSPKLPQWERALYE